MAHCRVRIFVNLQKAAEQSVQPTGEIRRDLRAFSTLEANPALRYYPSPPTSG
jgi:hypothetical protein